MLKMFKEPFVGSYDGITPATLLPVGAISDGLNVRKIGERGGWKPRKGCTLHNSTVLGNADVLSLHQYIHPRNDDYHFLAQYNGNLYDATNDPPAAGTTFGTSLVSGLSTTIPGFSTMVGETFCYADGSGAPTVYGGTTPFCSGFLTVEDGTSANYIDYTREVVDERATTHAILFTAAAGRYYVCSPEIAESITLDLGNVVNANAVTAVVKSWQAGAWSSRTGDAAWADGTASGGATHAVDGTIAWTRQSSDTMRVLGGVMGYWYEVTTSGAISANVKIISCKVVYDATTMTNKWNGVHEFPAAVRFYDQSATEYVDNTGKITNESTSQYMQIGDMTTSDFIYVKGIESLGGIGFGVVPEYEQTIAAKIDNVEVWTGVAWTSVGGIIDGTLDEAGDSSFAQTGIVWFNAAAVTPKRRTFDWDSIPGYWYRVSINVTFTDDDIRIFMVSTTMFPAKLSAADGVIEFKNRLFIWGDPEYPNRLRYSTNGRPDCFSGSDSGYTDAFGDMKPITCALRFYNELIVWKENSVWLLEGYSPQTFGTLRIADTIGLASPKSAVVVETGYPAMKTDEPLSIALWEDTDGVYVLDGRKPKKVSGPVDHYFNTEYASAIPAVSIKNRQSFVDPLNNEYHLLLPTSELVYNYVRAEWYPPWERDIDLLCGLSFRGTDDRYYVYGGDANGHVFRLENDTSDKNAAGADVAISHKVKTRAISAKQPEPTTLRFTFRKLWIEAQARGVSTALVTKFYKNIATSGTVLNVPAVLNVQESGKDLSVPGLDTSQEECMCFEIEFSLAVIDLEMELWSFLYQVESRGEIEF